MTPLVVIATILFSLRPFNSMIMRLFAIVSMICLFVLTSCAMQPRKEASPPMEFKAAIRTLAQNLFSQLTGSQNILSSLTTDSSAKKLVLLDPFVDANTGEGIKVSLQIEKLLRDYANTHFKQYVLHPLTPDKFAQASYVMTGIIYLDEYHNDDKRYHIAASIFQADTGKIVAQSEAWIANQDLDYTPIPIYQDNPMYMLKDPLLKGMVETAKAPPGESAQRDYFDALRSQAVTLEATAAYEKKDYNKALSLFQKAIEQMRGQTMKAYSGLYQTYLKMNKLAEAEKVFATLFALGVRNNNISVRFLFSVNSVEFMENPELRTQYAFWLRQIGKYFSNNKLCAQIVGHSSLSGSEKYNEDLSQRRAQRVHQLLQPYFPTISKRAVATGKGFKETIIGSGTDDLRDAVDRRVEFVIVECSQIISSNKLDIEPIRGEAATIALLTTSIR